MSAGADVAILALMVDGGVLEGTLALQRADWDGARRSFASVLETADVPEARDGLGLAQWFLGSVAEGIAAEIASAAAEIETGAGAGRAVLDTGRAVQNGRA